MSAGPIDEQIAKQFLQLSRAKINQEFTVAYNATSSEEFGS